MEHLKRPVRGLDAILLAVFVLLVVLAVLLAPEAKAQSIDPATGAMKVYCVSSTCSPGGAAGDVNIASIGGTAVTAPSAASPDPVYFPTTPTVNLGGSAPASAEYLSTQPTLVSTNVGPLLTDTRGNLKVTINGNNSSTAVSLATSTNQTTANTSLASIDTKIPASPATAGNQTTANTSLASIDTKTPALGSATSANSSPVVVASDQGAIPVTFPTTSTLSCQYNVTPPTQTDGTSGIFQCDNRLHLAVTLFANNGATAISASRNDQTVADSATNGKLVVMGNNYSHNGTTWYQDWAELPGSGNMAAKITKPYAPQASSWNYTGSISNTTTANTIKTAPASGLTACVTGLQISSDALTAATTLSIRSGAGGTVIWSGRLQTAAQAVSTVDFPTPVCALATATLLEIVTPVATGGGIIYIDAQGYSF